MPKLNVTLEAKGEVQLKNLSEKLKSNEIAHKLWIVHPVLFMGFLKMDRRLGQLVETEKRSEDGGLDLGLEAPKERHYPLLRCKPPSTAALLHTTATPLHAIGAGTDNGKSRWSGQRIHKIKKDSRLSS
ncbi:hypothetical protein LXL04_006663 [Taraxacum kok-saghyz]